MKKEKLLAIIEDLDDDDDVDLNEIAREEYERREELINELEERQHASGFYAFQDKMDMWRRER